MSKNRSKRLNLGIPAGEAHLPQFEVDGVCLVATCSLTMREEEVGARAARQRDASNVDCWSSVGELVLWLS